VGRAEASASSAFEGGVSGERDGRRDDRLPSARAQEERSVVEIAVGAARGDASLEGVVHALLEPLDIELR
jgi:hypothetical protein